MNDATDRTPFEQQATYLARRLPPVILSNTDPTGRGRGKASTRPLPAPVEPQTWERPLPAETTLASLQGFPAVEVCDLPVDHIARGRVITARLKSGEMSIKDALAAFNAAGPFQRRYIEIDAVEVAR